MNRTTTGSGSGISLRARIALAIAVLAVLPNALLTVGAILPSFTSSAGVPRELWIAGLVWAVMAVVLSALVGYLASRELLSPLTRLSKSVAAMSLQSERLTAGRLGAGPGEPDEVSAVRTAFNRLLDQIELEHGRRAAFIATLMHDLKTPLVATSHLLEVIRDNDELGRSDRVALVDRLLRENRALVELMQKLVDAHKFDRDEVHLNREDLSVDEVAQIVMARLAPLAEERNLELWVDGRAEARADRAELERALYNLVSNSVRYARTKIEVHILGSTVRILDDGPGLPGPLERLAQPFNEQPVEISGKNYRAGSAGLGLFIARRILEAHGGRLECEETSSRGTSLLAHLGPESVSG